MLFTWEPGSAQGLLLLLIDKLAFCCQSPFPLLAFYPFTQFCTVMVESLVPRELSTAFRVITAVCECYECRPFSRLRVIFPCLCPSLFSHCTTTCEKLEKARNELQIAYGGFVQKLNQQHQTDLTELENQLKEFSPGTMKASEHLSQRSREVQGSTAGAGLYF